MKLSIGKNFKFDNNGLNCTKRNKKISYEDFVSISHFDEDYEISYKADDSNIKKVEIEISYDSQQSFDEFIKSKFPHLYITERKAGFFRCSKNPLFFWVLYTLLFIASRFHSSGKVRIPVVIYPVYCFMVYGSFTTNLIVILVLLVLTTSLGIFFYFKDNTIYEYHLNTETSINS